MCDRTRVYANEYMSDCDHVGVRDRTRMHVDVRALVCAYMRATRTSKRVRADECGGRSALGKRCASTHARPREQRACKWNALRRCVLVVVYDGGAR